MARAADHGEDLSVNTDCFCSLPVISTSCFDTGLRIIADGPIESLRVLADGDVLPVLAFHIGNVSVEVTQDDDIGGVPDVADCVVHPG